MLDFDVYNPNEVDVIVYIHDRPNTSLSPTVGFKWQMVVPAGVTSPLQYGTSGKSWDAGLHFRYNIVAVAKTVTGADPASEIKINIRASST